MGVAPHRLRACIPAELQAVIGLGGDGPVHIHLAEQTREVEDCPNWCGQSPATWLLDAVGVDERWCLIHATHVEDHELERIAGSGAVVGLCPITKTNLVGDGIFPAARFAGLSGSYGIGSDSNVLIDAAQELRTLEYGQRLARRARNIMAAAEGRSTGRVLFDSTLAGDARALGTTSVGIRAGVAADRIALDPNHDDLADRHGDSLVDAWIFAARRPAIDCVCRHGQKVVSGGRHLERHRIASRFRTAIRKIIQD